MRHSQAYHSLRALAVCVTIAAFGTACGNTGDTIGKAQDGIDRVQDGASKAADITNGVPTSAADVEEMAKKKGTDLLTRDMALSGNAQCSKKANDKVTLSKLQDWKAGPYYLDIRYNKTSPDGPFTAYISAYADQQPLNGKADADPMNDWSVDCNKLPVGYFRIQFISGSPNIGQLTEPNVLHVTE